jgi:hypothetical protein
VGSIGWSSSNGGLAAADSSIEEDRDRNMVVTTTIRTATAIVIRIMTLALFGRDCACRDCAWCGKASVELIGWSPVADMRTQIERAALRRYFSLGKTVAIVAERFLARQIWRSDGACPSLTRRQSPDVPEECSHKIGRAIRRAG